MRPSSENALPPLNLYYRWRPEGKPLAVYLDLAVAENLFSRVTQTSENSPEFGGLLLGRAEQSGSGEWSVVVDRFEPFEVEYRYGPHFVLSPGDRQKLQQRIVEWNSKGVAVVGLFRSHTRPGLYLDQKDFSLFQLFFSEPSAVCLLAKREERRETEEKREVEEGRDATAGFFFWENGDVQRHASHMEFPLNPERLRRQPSSLVAVEAKPQPVDQAVLPAAVAEHHPWLQRVAIALLLLLIPIASFTLVRAIVLSGRRAARRTHQDLVSQHPQLTLTARQVGRALLLTWDPGSQAVQKADHAHLFVQDGGNHKQLWFDSRQLAAGRFSYEPVYRPGNRNVVFRMDTYTAPLHTQNLSAAMENPEISGEGEHQPTDSAPATPSRRARYRLRLPSSSRGRRDPFTRRDDFNSASRNEDSLRKSDSKPGVVGKIASAETAVTLRNAPPGAHEAHTTLPAYADKPVGPVKQTSLPEAPPALSHPAPLPERPAVLPDPLKPVEKLAPPPASSTVTVEPARGPMVREALQKIPIIRRLQSRRYKGGERFVPARPVKPVAPPAPPDLKPGQVVRVDLLVKLDKAGRVRELRYDPDAGLAGYAAYAVRRWQFEPARLNGSPVASDLIVHVEFAHRSLQSRR